MKFLTTLVALATHGGAALGGPVGDCSPLQERAADMFKFCTDGNLQGRCTKDSTDNVNLCELHRDGTGASALVYRGFECSIYKGYKCDDQKLVLKSGQQELPDDFRDHFHSYECKRA